MFSTGHPRQYSLAPAMLVCADRTRRGRFIAVWPQMKIPVFHNLMYPRPQQLTPHSVIKSGGSFIISSLLILSSSKHPSSCMSSANSYCSDTLLSLIVLFHSSLFTLHSNLFVFQMWHIIWLDKLAFSNILCSQVGSILWYPCHEPLLHISGRITHGKDRPVSDLWNGEVRGVMSPVWKKRQASGSPLLKIGLRLFQYELHTVCTLYSMNLHLSL